MSKCTNSTWRLPKSAPVTIGYMISLINTFTEIFAVFGKLPIVKIELTVLAVENLR